MIYRTNNIKICLRIKLCFSPPPDPFTGWMLPTRPHIRRLWFLHRWEHILTGFQGNGVDMFPFLTFAPDRNCDATAGVATNVDVLTQRRKQAELFFSLLEISSELGKENSEPLAESRFLSTVSSLREFLNSVRLRNPVLTNEPSQRVEDQEPEQSSSA